MSSKMTTEKKLRLGMVTVVLLMVCLVMTTYALMRVTLDIKNNTFHTGQIGINLNDGKSIIDPNDPMFQSFEPGVLAKTEFFIENDESTWDVYYRLYFSDIDGDLADVLEVTITDPNPNPHEVKGPTANMVFTEDRRKDHIEGEVLYHGTLSEMTRNAVPTANDILAVGERRNLHMYFYFPTDAGNETMNMVLQFSVCADAVQTKNNTNKDFGPDIN